ncbi:MAG: bacteriohemerythrin [Terracidiphilus sp.]
MTWTSDLSVGVEVLDDDHKKLMGIINQLHFGITSGHKKEVLASVLDELVEYTKFHFAREEAFFLQTNYLASSSHKLEHETFIKRISNLQTRFKNTPVAMLDLELMSFLRNWLVTHIQGSDKQYGPRLNAHGIF